MLGLIASSEVVGEPAGKPCFVEVSAWRGSAASAARSSAMLPGRLPHSLRHMQVVRIGKGVFPWHQL
ncbi:hypothetical protein BanimalisJ1_01390 [Bifidobacterium animalis]|nr:hypothetical protein BanimalisJ1_01390 [Bifidobacterium animalis]GEA00259.1 hypothetical protein BanimalisJ3_07170 [Bifidobacterium animalis]